MIFNSEESILVATAHRMPDTNAIAFNFLIDYIEYSKVRI